MLKEIKRQKRKKSIRKKISGTSVKPRVYVFKSNKYLNAGVTDDVTGKVLGGGSEARNESGATKLGDKMAKLLKSKKVEQAVFDRSGYKYHGIVAKFVDQLRNNGIKI